MLDTEGKKSNIGFPIVGIVASAGGLDAFKQFFNAMPADSGMAFVLIPHLDPTHESLMVGLLDKLTPMPVVEAQQDLTVQINHVYIIPPNKFLAISNGELQLSAPPRQRGWRTSIDFFLKSLAHDQTENAVGIVLSGTGSHGAVGVREIKLAGGLTMAQQPTTAEYDQMPKNAIATGKIDWILPPEQMPAELVKYIEQPYVSQSVTDTERVGTPPAELSEQLQQVLAFLKTKTKYDFRSYRQAMVMRRIQRRMSLAKIDSLTDYLALLRQTPEEATKLYKDLLISVTAFFRDPEAFKLLQQEWIPTILERKIDDSPIRVWVPGCATGEEAYSIGMLLLEATDPQSSRDATSALESVPVQSSSDNATPRVLQIFASDLDDDAIAFARAGIYPACAVTEISADRLSRFFTALDDSHYQVTKQLRDTVVFSRQNLISDAPFSKLDLISCRNLLIYLEPKLQQTIIELFEFALVPDGFLLLGPSETIGRSIHHFENVSKKWRIFRRIGSATQRPPGTPRLNHDPSSERQLDRLPPGMHRKSLKEIIENLILNEYAPAAALINRKFEILYLTGQLVNYLEFPTGELTKDLFAMARLGLRTKLRIACQSAVRDSQTTIETEARVKRNGRYVPCSLTVQPLSTPKEVDGLLLVTFRDSRESPSSHSLDSGHTINSSQFDDSAMVQQLEQELKSLNEQLQTTIEEMEGSTEELKTSNEEIMSVNEELQSANEELETSKEELQALNEELVAVNNQLQDKVSELDQSKDDLINLMSSTEIATIFIDQALNIKRFTPPTAALLNLRTNDVGRPFGEIRPKFIDDQMLVECHEVLETLVPAEREILTDDSRYFLRRILPYRSIDHHLGGVVITFVDLTQRKHAEAAQHLRDAEFVAALHESKERLSAILDTAADAIITIDERGNVDSINRVTELLFGYKRRELIGQSFSLLAPSINGAERDFSISEHLKSQLSPKMEVPRETVARRKDGSVFPIELTFGVVDHLGLFTGILRDISERKKLQSDILEIAAEEQRRIGHELHDGTQQELTGLSLFAGTLCDLLETATASQPNNVSTWTLDEKTVSRLKQTANKLLAGLKTANQNVHKLSHGIMPVQIDLEGLRSALSELANSTNEIKGVHCRFEATGTSGIPNNSMATQLYRIAQESLNNALTHGRATEIDIVLLQSDEQITLEVRDNGVGMDPNVQRDPCPVGNGVGLRIMAYRASLLGGILQIEPNASRGLTVRCVIPIMRI